MDKLRLRPGGRIEANEALNIELPSWIESGRQIRVPPARQCRQVRAGAQLESSGYSRGRREASGSP